MAKPTAARVAEKAVALATGRAIPYGEMDCQAFVEACVNGCGGALAAAGSNDMLRNHAVWRGTLACARAEGRLVPGAAVLIREKDESGLPAKYQGDGYGDFSHIGLYAGEGALRDVDKNGVGRLCDVVHSSATMGRVAGSTLANGWTHVMWFRELDYGEKVALEAELGAEEVDWAEPLDAVEAIGEAEDAEDAEAEPSGAVEAGPLDATALAELFAPTLYATVFARNGKPVKMRKRASSACPTYWNVPVGEVVQVLRPGKTWCRIRRNSRTGFMLTRFLCLEESA